MKLDRMDVPLGIIIIGILLVIINLSLDGSFGFNVHMREGTWAGMGFILAGLVGLMVGTCDQRA